MFRATDDAVSLAERFGAGAVAKGDIYVGEGKSEAGTILFGESPRDRVEILWKDVSAQRLPRSVRIRGDRSNWRTPAGVSLGDDLRRLEQLNGRPFRLAGFGWDYSGTELSWAGGRLEAAPAASCSTRVRMRPDYTKDNQLWYRQVIGAREFSSGHPAMQVLNPRVNEVWLDFATAGSGPPQPSSAFPLWQDGVLPPRVADWAPVVKRRRQSQANDALVLTMVGRDQESTGAEGNSVRHT